MSGLPGLIHVPGAWTVPSGTVDLTYDGAPTPAVIPGFITQRNGFIVLGFLPRLTVAARGTVTDTGGTTEVRDLSANASLLLRHEGARTPSISIGVQDIGQGATPYFPSRFLVASKTIFDRARLTAGYGTGPDVLDGMFGGAELRLGRWATALGEFDGSDWNGGVRIFPFPSLSDRLGLQPRIDAVWRQDKGTAAGVGIRTLLGGRRRARPQPAPSAAPMDGQVPSRTGSVSTVERQLVKMGFENIRVSIARVDSRPTLAIDYENRRFNRDELDALGIVMGVAALHAPDSVTRMRVTVRRVDIPVLTVTSSVAAYIAFVNDRLPDAEFAEQLGFTNASAIERSSGAREHTAPVNPSRWKLDLFLRPRVETTVLTDLGVADARVSLLPNAIVHLGRGFVLNAQRAIPVATTQRYPDWIEDPNADRLLVHKAMAVPLGGRLNGASAVTQFTVGRFGHEAVGIAHEVDISLRDGLVSLSSSVAVFGKSYSDLDHSVALGTARVRYPAWDLTASLTAGRFRNGDNGAAAELSRFFGATELGFFVRATEFASVAGARISLPLAPARELPPTRIRPRLPDAHVQALQSTILDPIPLLRRDVGRLLATDHETGLVFRTRDRLQPVTVRGHVDELRNAVRRWLEPAIFPDRS